MPKIIEFKITCISCGKEVDKVNKYGSCKECERYFHEQWKCTGLNPNIDNQKIQATEKRS